MSLQNLVVSCPYCRRQYAMKLDREQIEREKKRATCGRCGNSFELASRIVVARGLPGTPPPPPPKRAVGQAGPGSESSAPAVTPPPPPVPAARSTPAIDPDALAREAAQAAPQPAEAPVEVPTEIQASPSGEPAAAIEAPAESNGTFADPAPLDAASVDASYDEISVGTDAPPEEPPAPVAPPAPRVLRADDWIGRADPGLGYLVTAESAASAALEQLLP